jgi:hypothetical protein
VKYDINTLSIERIRRENPFLTGKIAIAEICLLGVSKLYPKYFTVKVEITCTGNCYCAEYLWNNDSKFWDLVVND